LQLSYHLLLLGIHLLHC